MTRHAKLNSLLHLPFPVIYKKIMLTGLIDAFFLVYEPDSFPITKKEKEINLMDENKLH